MKKKGFIFTCFIGVWVTVLLLFVVQFGNVRGQSMEPTYHNDDLLVIHKLPKDIVNEDIVVIWSDSFSSNLVKRVLGVGGETVRGVSVPEGYLFIGGDNKEVSLDSTSDRIGLIHEEDIVGRVVYKVPYITFNQAKFLSIGVFIAIIVLKILFRILRGIIHEIHMRKLER